MSEIRSFVLEFAVRVVIPTVIAAAGLALLLLYIFNGIFNGANTLDRSFAQRSVHAAVQSVRDDMAALALSKAWEIAKSGIDAQTALRNATTKSDYDAAFLVDSQGRTMFASMRGSGVHSTAQPVESFLGPEIIGVIDKLPHGGTHHDATAATLKSPSGVAIVGASTIGPPNAAGPDAPRLVLVKIIDKDVLATLAREFGLDGLRFVEKLPASGTGIEMVDGTGGVIATLTWTDRQPGFQLEAKFKDIVGAAISLFLLVVGVLLYISWRGFKQAHQSRASAIAASLRDDLTGLANRRQLMNVLTQRLAHARSIPAGGLSVVYADLDGFKEVNDAYGHEIGDLLLKSAAAGFAFIAQDKDVVSRLGGDEFAVIVSGADAAQQSRLVAQRMIAFLAEPMSFGGRIASVSVSVGIVDLAEDAIDTEEVLRRADVAMYAAKAAGRNRIQIYQASLDSKRNESRAIARELRQAIDAHKLTVVYQPVVDARSRRTVGVEALVRWPADAPRRVTPDVFIPVAEEFGMIEDLGNFVMFEACRQAARWPDIFVAVNVSPIQFMNPSFAETVEKALRATGLDPRRLEIEVTEGFVIDNAERATAIIDRLHDMRVSVALDDFGTGYSSIGHLRRFKFDKLKLDRSMVVDILRQPSALRLVQGTIAMADALGLRVTAEGIEDENQVSVLRLAGCSQFQGFLFSRPVDAALIPQFIQPHPTAVAV